MAENSETKSPGTDQALDYERFVYLQVRDKLQTDLEAWSQRRFWWLVIPSALVGVVGLSSLAFATIFSIFQGDIQLAQKATAKAEVAADHADKSSADISSDFKKLNITITELNKAATSIGGQLNELKGTIGAEGDNARKNADTKIAVLETRLQHLSDLVEEMAATSGEFRELISKFKANVDEQKQKSEAKIGLFESNSKYFVSVCTISESMDNPSDLGVRIGGRLKEEGYKVSASCWSKLSHFFQNGMGSDALYIIGAPDTNDAITSIVNILKKQFPDKKIVTAEPGPATSDVQKNRFFADNRQNSGSITIATKADGT